MLIAVLKNKFTVSFIIIFGTLSFQLHTEGRSDRSVCDAVTHSISHTIGRVSSDSKKPFNSYTSFPYDDVWPYFVLERSAAKYRRSYCSSNVTTFHGLIGVRWFVVGAPAVVRHTACGIVNRTYFVRTRADSRAVLLDLRQIFSRNLTSFL